MNQLPLYERLEKKRAYISNKLYKSRISGVYGYKGKHRERLHFMAQGLDDSPVIPLGQEPDAKSVGHSMTLERDIGDNETLERYILLLSEMVGSRLRHGHYRGRTITLTIRYTEI